MMLLKLTALLLLVVNCSCASARFDRADALAQIDVALDRGAAFLLSRQSPDGAWRSQTYGFMRDGPSLTPHVAHALASLVRADTQEAIGRARNYLTQLAASNLNEQPLIFPVYTAADSILLLGDRKSPWNKYLLDHHLGRANGWEPADPEFGGWGYALRPSIKSQSGHRRGPWDFSNLSATVYALRAVHASGLPPNDPLFEDVRPFIHRCQNFPDGDGGFFFSPAEPIRNKAGQADDDATRFNSYGSMTADGIIALLLCGAEPGDPRLAAAQRWLEESFSPSRNPGTFVPQNEDLRDATYYYYSRSVAEALDRLKTQSGRCRDWPRELARALIERQSEDGSWANSFTDAREDDPLVSTPLAMLALHTCRRALVAR